MPVYSDDRVSLYHGDCLDVLAGLGDASVDAVVTDPPYGLEFMGKDWDAPWRDERTDKRGVIDPDEWGGSNPYSRARIRTAAAHAGGDVLEPFAGSGTTAEACVHEHRNCIAIEREGDYIPLIVARLTKPMEVGFDFDGAGDG
jgi:DNA modification methylase